MVQINMEMPKSCRECPFQDDVKGCQIIPFVPAWIQDILWHPDCRSEHCPLVEIPEKVEHRKLESPKTCGECKSMAPYGDKFYCHMDAIFSKSSCQDISSIFLNPSSKPDWCPIDKTNADLDNMPPFKRVKFDKIMEGFSELFSTD